MLEFLQSNWTGIAWGLGIVLVIATTFFFLRRNTAPKHVELFVSYLNLRPARQEKVGLYSKVLAQFEPYEWLYLFSQKLQGNELHFGSFESKGKEYTCFISSEEGSPMIVTNTNSEYEYEFRAEMDEHEVKLNFWAKDRFMLENIKKSTGFNTELYKAFVDSRAWYEFTELKQIVLVTDQKFDTLQELADYYIIFKGIKGKL